MMDYSLKSRFPSQELIEGMIKKPVLEQQMRESRQKMFTDALGTLNQGLNTVSEKKRRIAAAMTMANSPAVQEAMGAGVTVPAAGPATEDGKTPTYTTPNFTPAQIEPLLGEKAGADYLGDLQKMNTLQRLQKSMQAKGTVVTPVVNPATGEVTYSTTQVTPGATVQHPVRLPRAAGARATGQTDEYNQLLKNRAGFISQRAQFFDPNDPRAQEIDQNIAQLNARLNEIHPLGTPGANTATGAPVQKAGRVPPGYPPAPSGRVYVQGQDGKYHTVPQAQLQSAIDQGYSPI